MLGDLLAQFEDEAVAAEALLSLDDLALVARVQEAAARAGLDAGTFASASVGRFVNGASDEDWLGLLGAVSKAEDPGAAFLKRVLAREIAG
jgi:hypothetical protein